MVLKQNDFWNALNKKEKKKEILSIKTINDSEIEPNKRRADMIFLHLLTRQILWPG